VAAPDQSSAPRGGGIPLWLILVAGGGLALFLYLRSRRNAATSTTTSPGAGVVTDPNTGLPVDPLTGLPYVTQPTNTPQTLSDWASNAFKVLTANGVDPAAAAQALYDYTNAQQLSSTEAGIIDKALSLAGYPPEQLPFNGTVPTTGPTGKPPASGFITSAAFQHLTRAQQALYYAITTANGAHGYLPIGTALPSGAKLGYPGNPAGQVFKNPNTNPTKKVA
jgi:hypothetical protein